MIFGIESPRTCDTFRSLCVIIVNCSRGRDGFPLLLLISSAKEPDFRSHTTRIYKKAARQYGLDGRLFVIKGALEVIIFPVFLNCQSDNGAVAGNTGCGA